LGIKESDGEIVDPLVLIVQNSLDMGKLPVDWKNANVTFGKCGKLQTS